ncbi:hypothetical protein CcaCcLH18_13609 [Colletotrichum camelliae]|nr:hypothetical protein CcaCcLH18_13609 [Colletotrichum camelliae]
MDYIGISLELMPPELLEIVLDNLQPTNLISLMRTCRSLRALSGSVLHRKFFFSYMLPLLVLCLINSSGTARLESTTTHIQQVVLAALNLRSRYLAGSPEVFVAAEFYTAELEPPSCFNMQRSQRARTHVHRAFWNARITLLHAAAMSGADDVAYFSLDHRANVNTSAAVGSSRDDYGSFPNFTPFELAIAYQRANTAVVLLKAGTSNGRGWELALDGEELELIRLILAHDPVIAKRPIFTGMK